MSTEAILSTFFRPHATKCCFKCNAHSDRKECIFNAIFAPNQLLLLQPHPSSSSLGLLFVVPVDHINATNFCVDSILQTNATTTFRVLCYAKAPPVRPPPFQLPHLPAAPAHRPSPLVGTCCSCNLFVLFSVLFFNVYSCLTYSFIVCVFLPWSRDQYKKAFVVLLNIHLSIFHPFNRIIRIRSLFIDFTSSFQPIQNVFQSMSSSSSSQSLITDCILKDKLWYLIDFCFSFGQSLMVLAALGCASASLLAAPVHLNTGASTQYRSQDVSWVI